MEEPDDCLIKEKVEEIISAEFEKPLPNTSEFMLPAQPPIEEYFKPKKKENQTQTIKLALEKKERERLEEVR